MRLFVAVLPPSEVLDQLEAVLEPRRESGAGGELRWTDRHQWHVTLAFFGDVPERRLDDLTEALAASVSGRDPVALRLAGAGTFPTRMPPACCGPACSRWSATSRRWHTAYAPRRARSAPRPTAPPSTRT
ncbi:MAG: 2'-5' RNA ligase family protein [Humibacillus sp.]